jgi:hypothetical protein
MNAKTAKKLRRFAKTKDLDPKKVKKSFQRLDNSEQKLVAREVFK